MSIFDKDADFLGRARDVVNKVKDKSQELVGDETIADLIETAAEKQEAVNRVLVERGSNYRISGMSVEMGLPPRVSFSVNRTTEVGPVTKAFEEPKSTD